MDLSIIVPVYNTPETFLEKCFQSVFRLYDIDFELLIVDDGSKEPVGDYCSGYARSHARCRYFRKENSGVSSARNMGLAEAEGDFIMFVDSDDELIPDAFRAESWGGYDFVVYDTVMHKGKRQILQNGMGKTDQSAECQALLTGMVMDGLFGFIHGIVYRRKFLLKNRILFHEDTIQREDADFNFNVLIKEPRIKYIPAKSYMYRYRAGNAIERWRKAPDLMIRSGAERHEKEMAVISNQTMLGKRLLERRILGIYQSAIDLCCAGKLTADRRKTIRNLMLEMEIKDQNSLSPSAARKRRLVSENRWAAIWIFAKARMAYLKARGFY